MNNIHIIVILVTIIYFIILKKYFKEKLENNEITRGEFIKYLSIVPGIIYFYYYVIYNKQSSNENINTNVNTKTNTNINTNVNTNLQKSVDKLSSISVNSILSAPYPASSSISISSI